jgi:hypothetical protein
MSTYQMPCLYTKWVPDVLSIRFYFNSLFVKYIAWNKKVDYIDLCQISITIHGNHGKGIKQSSHKCT